MYDTFVWCLTGDFGSGKTVMSTSYVPKRCLERQTKRLMIDMEYRAIRYQSEHYGKSEDDPKNLLYSFSLYPDGDVSEFTLADWKGLGKLIKSDQRPDVLIFDNMASFQTGIEGWCQDKQGSTDYLEAVDALSAYKAFINYRFNTVEPAWRKLMQAGMKAMIMLCKKNGVDVIFSTELQNVWVNYGQKGKDAEGNPLMKIVGRQAKVWDMTLQLADVNWLLTRSQDNVKAAPVISIDPRRPKMSIVGIPPKFQFTDWKRIWQWETDRLVPDENTMGSVVVPPPTYDSPETPDLQEQPVAEPTPEKPTQEAFLKWAGEQGWTPDTMWPLLRKAGLAPYKAANDAQMREVLVNAKFS